MNLLFIGVACTDDAINESNIKYYNNIGQVRPQQHFDYTLVSGISNSCKVTAITLPPVAAFPRSKCIFYKRKEDKVSNNLCIRYIPLINLPFIKNIIIMVYIFIKVILFGIMNKKNDSAVLMGYISSDTSMPAMLATRLTKTKIFSVVPDVPKFSNTYTNINNVIRRSAVKLNSTIDKIIQCRFDGYIFLTKAMNELINCKNKPYTIVEGMIKREDCTFDKVIQKQDPRVIMYAGTLHVKFGIKKLIDAFNLCNLENCELWIFGVGDYQEEIKNIANMNHNIIYKGSVSRNEILENERRATLLINPRPSIEEFTKYSFPSKTIEYMASGTPLLSTQLSGIPEEYFNYIFSFTNEEIESMAFKINSIMKMSNEKLNDIGQEAREFILKNKNNIVQGKKIYEFISNYDKNK